MYLPFAGAKSFSLFESIERCQHVVLGILVDGVPPPNQLSAGVRNTEENNYSGYGHPSVERCRNDIIVAGVKESVVLLEVVVEHKARRKIKRIVV